jgi:hypothetical protein
MPSLSSKIIDPKNRPIILGIGFAVAVVGGIALHALYKLSEPLGPWDDIQYDPHVPLEGPKAPQPD